MGIRKKGIFSDYLDRFDNRDPHSRYTSRIMHDAIESGRVVRHFDAAFINLGISPTREQRKYLTKQYKKLSKRAKDNNSLDVDFYGDEHRLILERIFATQAYIGANLTSRNFIPKILDNNRIDARAVSMPGNQDTGSHDYAILFDRKIIYLCDLISVFTSAFLLVDATKGQIGIPTFLSLLKDNRNVFKFYVTSIHELSSQRGYSSMNPKGDLFIRRQIYEACMAYVFSHEISHVVLGHLEESVTRQSEFDDEIQADELTAKIMKDYGKKHGNSFCESGIGALLLLFGVQHIKHSSGEPIEDSSSHPEENKRIKTILDSLSDDKEEKNSAYSDLQLAFLSLMIDIGASISEIKLHADDFQRRIDEDPNFDLSSLIQ